MSTVSPVELLQILIRFNTTNPPGNEAGCISYINNLLADEGFETTLLARGRALHDLAHECLQEIVSELDGHVGVTKLKSFVALTCQGMKVTEASRNLRVTPEYASRAFKRNLVELLAEKLSWKLH